jgi:hypothetical protein
MSVIVLGPNPLFVDWSSDNCNRQNKKSAPAVIIEDPELIKGGFTHPE